MSIGGLSYVSRPFHLKPKTSHRQPVRKDPAPEANFVAMHLSLVLGVRCVDRSIVGYSLNYTIAGRGIRRDLLPSRFKRTQIRFLAALFQLGQNGIESAPQGSVISSSARRINDQQHHASKRRRDHQPHRSEWNNLSHRGDGASTKKDLHTCEEARQASERLLTDCMVGNLLAQSKFEVMALYSERFGGGGGGAKFVSPFLTPESCPGGDGRGGGGRGVGGGAGRSPLFACHVDGSIEIAPRSLGLSRGYADRRAQNVPVRPVAFVISFRCFRKYRLHHSLGYPLPCGGLNPK